ncbi:MAG: hypothetical protein DWH81_15915 [Planctomycetota bacterium]|nr:MAG: hypothetical protein DWH81_15915 [Planctomycetota bacterium]
MLRGNLLCEQTFLVNEVMAENATIAGTIEFQPLLSIFRMLTIPVVPEVDKEARYRKTIKVLGNEWPGSTTRPNEYPTAEAVQLISRHSRYDGVAGDTPRFSRTSLTTRQAIAWTSIVQTPTR